MLRASSGIQPILAKFDQQHFNVTYKYVYIYIYSFTKKLALKSMIICS